jgi:hypothetical protein
MEFQEKYFRNLLIFKISELYFSYLLFFSGGVLTAETSNLMESAVKSNLMEAAVKTPPEKSI